jgi:acetyl-CoA acyltransferase
MRRAVIIDCVRTPIGRAHPEKGLYRDVRSDDLAVACVQALIERTKINPSQIEDLLFGCTQQAAEQGLNVAREIALVAGLPVTTGGTTINRLCGSSLQALNQAVHASSPMPRMCRSSGAWSTCTICRWIFNLTPTRNSSPTPARGRC